MQNGISLKNNDIYSRGRVPNPVTAILVQILVIKNASWMGGIFYEIIGIDQET